MSRDLRPYAQWPKPKSQVNAPVSLLAGLAQDAESGVWGFATTQAEAEGAFVADASGVLGIDDATTTHEAGLNVRLVGASRALVYTVS